MPCSLLTNGQQLGQIPKVCRIRIHCRDSTLAAMSEQLRVYVCVHACEAKQVHYWECVCGNTSGEEGMRGDDGHMESDNIHSTWVILRLMLLGIYKHTSCQCETCSYSPSNTPKANHMTITRNSLETFQCCSSYCCHGESFRCVRVVMC